MAGIGTYDDWTGNVIPDADMRSLDPEAVAALRAAYCLRHPESSAEAQAWSPDAFLGRAGLLKRGRLTVAAAILLGKASERMVPERVRIRWRLLDVDGRQADSRVFDGPMVLASMRAASAVRNWSVGTGSEAVSAYRTETILEAVRNAIAHQDYGLGGTVELIERDRESVTVRSRGTFDSPSPESMALGRASPSPSRNRFLRDAMSRSGLVPGRGTGIRGMYLSQIHRRFPLPSFVIDDDYVAVTIPGSRQGPVARALDSGAVTPEDAIALDRLCSGRFVPEREMRSLAEKGLADFRGGIPCAVVDPMAASSGSARDAVLRMMSEGPCTRSDVALMLSHRSPGLTDEQLSVRATNILQSLRREGRIRKVSGSTKSAAYSIILDGTD